MGLYSAFPFQSQFPFLSKEREREREREREKGVAPTHVEDYSLCTLYLCIGKRKKREIERKRKRVPRRPSIAWGNWVEMPAGICPPIRQGSAQAAGPATDVLSL
jgi:hypothetical protein